MRPALLLALLLSVPAGADDLKVGAASVDITPPVGTPMAGYYSERAAEGVHDPLYAKALVLEQDGTKAALVALDLITTTSRTRRRGPARDRGDHRHPGRRRDDLRHPRPHRPGPLGQGARDDAVRGQEPADRRSTARAARQDRRGGPQGRGEAQARPGLGRARATSRRSAFNRRFHMNDGTVGWNPGKLNPKIVKPAGPIDPDVAVVYFESADEESTPLATYVNYAVHLDNVGGPEFSADLPATRVPSCWPSSRGRTW